MTKAFMNSQSFDEMREMMVETQLVPRGISDKRVLDTFRKVPRHEFVPEEFREDSYSDHPLSIGGGQTISQPYMVALMTECLALKGNERVLEIGTGSGYQAAILADLAKDVYSVERIEALAVRAKKILDSLGYKNCNIKIDDGTLGWEEFAPYDGIIVTAGTPAIPESLVKQLKDTGRLVVPIGGGFGQILKIVEKKGVSVKITDVCGCVFVPLIGKEGWPDSRRGL